MKRNEISCLLRNIADADKEGLLNTLRRASASESVAGRHDWAVQIEGYAQRIERRSQSDAKMLTLLNATGKTNASLASFQMRIAIHGMTDIILSEELRNEVEETLAAQHQADRLREHNLMPPNRILLTGPPGSGKTMLAEILAKETNREFYVLKLGNLVGSLLGSTISNIESAFAAIAQSNAVFLFDEFDAIATSRSGKDSEINEMRRALNALLICFEMHKGDSVIIAATNRPDVLDTAFRRRFDCVWKLGEPKEEDRLRIIERTLKKHGMEHSIETIQTLTQKLNGLSFDECEDITKKLIVKAILSNKTQVDPNQYDESARNEVGTI